MVDRPAHSGWLFAKNEHWVDVGLARAVMPVGNWWKGGADWPGTEQERYGKGEKPLVVSYRRPDKIRRPREVRCLRFNSVFILRTGPSGCERTLAESA